MTNPEMPAKIWAKGFFSSKICGGWFKARIEKESRPYIDEDLVAPLVECLERIAVGQLCYAVDLADMARKALQQHKKAMK